MTYIFQGKKRNSLVILIALTLNACTTDYVPPNRQYAAFFYLPESSYASRMPSHINTRERTVVVDPTVHTWGAYGSDGNLIKAGLATAGGNWCPDINRPCRTNVGSFRVNSIGDFECISRIYPKPNGGGLMPYCMYFSGGEALHGSPDGTVIEDNVSHGCVRMRIQDAEWLRYNFVSLGTKVIVRPY